ncbi:hypothetical protein WJX79_000403 [Trebouxia sp. C0005]
MPCVVLMYGLGILQVTHPRGTLGPAEPALPKWSAAIGIFSSTRQAGTTIASKAGKRCQQTVEVKLYCHRTSISSAHQGSARQAYSAQSPTAWCSAWTEHA